MQLRLSDVQYAEFELTTRCNAHCPLCYRNYKTFAKHYPKNLERPVSDICQQISEMPNLKWIYLVGSISEPTMHSNFLQIVQFIKEKNILIELCTNGSTHNEDFWRALGNLLTEDDKVYFTICGSTQKIHATYRRGTNLAKILKNADALRTVKKCDYAQCIRFAYNNEDLNSENFRKIVQKFSHIYWTETFIKQPDEVYAEQVDWNLFKPHHNNFVYIQKLANKMRNISHKCDCESLLQHKIQVDVYGNIYPCYLFLEASRGAQWDLNYSPILNGKFECCCFCEKTIKRYLIKYGLENIV